MIEPDDTKVAKRRLGVRRGTADFATSSCGREAVLLRIIMPRFIILQAFIHTTRSSLTFPKYGEPAGIAHSRFLRMGHLL